MSKKIVPPLLVIVVAAGITAIISRPKSAEVREPDPIPPRQVEVIHVQLSDYPVRIHTQGFVTPRSRSDLASQVSGQIVEVSPRFYPGEFVAKDELLVRVDDADFKAEVSRQQAQVASARLRLAQEIAQSEQARLDWEASGNGAASPLSLRKPQLAEAEAQLTAAEAELDRAKRNLSRTEIRAPFEALIRTVETEMGEVVNPGSQIARLDAIDYAEIRLGIPWDDITYLPNDTEYSAHLTFAINGDTHTWETPIVRSEQTIDADSRTLFIVARLADPYARHSEKALPLILGSFVTAEVTGKMMKQVARIPRAALRGTDQVAVLTQENTVEIRDVTIRRTDSHFAYIAAGLSTGDRLCLTAPQTLFNGIKVNPQPIASTQNDA
ncbi:MAG: efflux RND transporter periplasmic adaptor subunit [Opitutales bacterium]|nr:efflux RND transporter periplasmic adaptor subunit [Opitutales bacterium]